MRIAYVILTCEKYIDTRVKWQKDSSLLNVKPEDIYYLGHKMNPEQRLYSWGASDEYIALPEKLSDCFRYLSFDEYQWVVVADDDTYIFTDRLQKYLSIYPSTSLISIGKILDHVKTEYFEYFAGGSGTCFSISLYNEIATHIRSDNNRKIYHWCADLNAQYWINEVKKKAEKEEKICLQLDNANFHPEYYNPTKDQISTAITFHHLKTKEQYMELALYNYTAQVIN